MSIHMYDLAIGLINNDRSEPTLLDLGIAISLRHGFAYRSRRNQWLCQSQTKNFF
ncbi:glycosyltransferase family 9 protein [Gloeocapsopsis crepidinum]|uniref:glycosyltransferase family 9 protein n=1 Tax=Gloeocapsopsis crepidinum TaxID=693223 RepID=UPI001D137215|nr:glycosyltransferase family 9 protein [Gloeocapsopsis crepidinum]